MVTVSSASAFHSVPRNRGSRIERPHQILGLVAMLVVLMTMMPYGARARTIIDDPLYGSPTGRGFFAEVLRNGQLGFYETERAAFIIDRGDGNFGCQLWPPTELYRQEHFLGKIPPGTVAIIHTHPMRWKRPSRQDQKEADRLGLPIYVLTLFNIYKAIPGHVYSSAVVDGEIWADRSPHNLGMCAPPNPAPEAASVVANTR